MNARLLGYAVLAGAAIPVIWGGWWYAAGYGVGMTFAAIAVKAAQSEKP